MSATAHRMNKQALLGMQISVIAVRDCVIQKACVAIMVVSHVPLSPQVVKSYGPDCDAATVGSWINLARGEVRRVSLYRTKIRTSNIFDKYDVLAPQAHSRRVSRPRVVPLACLAD